MNVGGWKMVPKGPRMEKMCLKFQRLAKGT